MPRDLAAPGLAQATALAAAYDAPDRDRDGCFPERAFAGIAELGLTANPPLRSSEIDSLLAMLAAVGRGDLSVGRIFEGHCNALLLIDLFGDASQIGTVRDLVRAGALFGVWNTDHPDDVVHLAGDRLTGRKNFASGAGGLSHALVTAQTDDGRIMVLVDLQNCPVDRGWWSPMGMRASCSHVVDLTGAPVSARTRVGEPGDYLRTPWLPAGAIRFAAVQTGGMHAVFDIAVAHLRKTGRTGQAYQQHRLGRMAIAVQTAYDWLVQASDAWREGCQREAPDDAAARGMAVAHATRIAVETQALAVLELAEQSVGAAGMIAPHPLERRLRDLRTYLRQPNPDGALAELGRVVAEGIWSPRIKADAL